ncbi:metallophosphoesterase family protein [Bradyrhizobium diazoefficiens]|uniref:metallophosphoesterase family protein n=1 Tax=Bradyrhizobium diazoefficiens TaxID=1355477 RepID=UPI002714E390|nr:metallophosphoesterase family protein [Bradyrhizobium diazoefficiens]WLA54301.1 metallophosphoesterase family protein [Bradyrhizobium diazoefficiens]
MLADIHGNAEALGKTLVEARKSGVEHLIVLGDIIGYYYAAREVLERLREWSFVAIRGNHERMFADALKSDRSMQTYRERYGSALDLAGTTLEPQDIDWLISLPDRASVQLGGIALELCHGSPRDPDEYVYPDANAATLEACRVAGADFVLMGHTHYPMLVAGGRPLLLNPGSVGQARDRGGLACWCRIDTDTRVVVMERAPYDTRALIDEVRRRDRHLPYLADVLERGNPTAASAD